jgi:cysteinyl-tRNA synthetase
MTLTLYNTLTRRKEPFKPIDPRNVRMYVCGPTVYDLAHIGNARPIIVFDVLFRLLRHIYGADHVTYARNITDVDDKINERAVERFPNLPPIEAIRKLTEETTAQFHKDIAALGVLEPTVEPRATDHIEGMRKLCDMLVANGHAYVAEDHVLFSVESMADYGKLARRSLDEMEAGARVDVAPYKRGPMDFVLWKPSKPGEPAWPSPAGIATPGRPGWHIECSAMAEKHLGPVFDIHGGGIDLVFPHHENEIAQSRCAHGTDVMANFWMHNGFLQVEGEKMSKSLGNFVTIKELLTEWPGDIVRLQMLMTHYRQPIDWTEGSSMLARSELDDWSHVLQSYICEGKARFLGGEVSRSVIAALSDDLNTPEALAALRDLYDKARNGTQKVIMDFAATCLFLGFKNLDKPGLFEWGVSTRSEDVAPAKLFEHEKAIVRYRAAIANAAPASTMLEIKNEIESDDLLIQINDRGFVLISGSDKEFTAKVESLINARLAARKAKDWKESDRIRDELAAMGIQLKDVKDPATGEIRTEWEVKR